MPENKGEVQAFRYDKDSIDEMRKIYVDILRCLGVKGAHTKLDAYAAEIADADKNGVMFNNLVSSLFATPEDRIKKASKIFEKIKDDEKISVYAKAYIAEMAGDYIPYDTVLTSARMVGGETGKGGKCLQMGCGEGKTGVLSMAAYAILQQNNKKQVFITSSTENLAAEALDKIEFYDKVGLAEQVVLVDSKGITKPVFENGKLKREDGKPVFSRIDLEGKSKSFIKTELAKAYKSRLVISDNVTLMQDAMKGYLKEPRGKERELLADEADFVLLDSYRPLQRTAEMSAKEMKARVTNRNLAYKILEDVKRQKPKGLFVKDDSSQYVDFTKEGRALVIKALKANQKSPDVDWNELYDYVHDALVVDAVYKENRDFQILNNGTKIVSEDRAAGVPIDLPEGVKQALEIKLQREGKYRGPISQERKVLDTLNTQSFFKKYFDGTKHFVSGTLGVDSKAIAKELENFGVSKENGDIYEAPPKEKRIRIDRERNFLKNETKKRKEIVKSVFEMLDAERPVLIGTVSENEINEVKTALKTAMNKAAKENPKFNRDAIRILEFTAASEDIFKQDQSLDDDIFRAKYGVEKGQYKDYKSLIKNESGRIGTITLGTSILGRGTTIKTTDRVNENGGIHVIIDGLHETSSRNQEQYKARTARGDNKGSTQEFFCPEDIPEEVRRGNYDVYKGMGADKIYEEVYAQIDARTSGIRNYVVQFVEKTVEKLDFIERNTALSEDHKAQAKALLTQRAFAIKNRACGVSDKFQNNIEEYNREIDAYTELYMAKYLVTDKEYLTAEGRFDEVKWLNQNGYKDIANIHIPFRRKSEQEIFKNQGLKASSIKAEPIKPKEEPIPEITGENDNKITDKEFENSALKDKAEEIIVDPNMNINDKEDIVNREEQQTELESEEVNFDRVGLYSKLYNFKQKSVQKIQKLFGIKTTIYDPKNSKNLRTSLIQEYMNIIRGSLKEQENTKDIKVADENKNQDQDANIEM